MEQNKRVKRKGEKGEKIKEPQVRAAGRCTFSPVLTLKGQLRETVEHLVLLKQETDTQKRQKITLPRRTSYMPACFVKWSNPSNNSEIWGFSGTLSVSQTPI